MACEKENNARNRWLSAEEENRLLPKLSDYNFKINVTSEPRDRYANVSNHLMGENFNLIIETAAACILAKDSL